MAFANIHGAKLWYQQSGSGEPLLLHHGYTASRVNWLPAATHLEQHYSVILMECRGTGESEHTESGYNIEQYAKDVVGLLDHLGIDQVNFAGHSMGGGIGYELATKHANRLKKLILMAPIPAGGITTMPPQALIEERLNARKQGDRNYFMADQLAQRFRTDVQTDEWLESRVDHLLSVSEGHLLGGLNSMGALDLESKLGEINTPTLMLAGAVDGLLGANLKDFASLPNATLHVLSRAGHEVAVHEPLAVADTIHQFIQHGPMTAATLAQRAEAAANAKKEQSA